jgi:hypothetical protein
MASRVASCALFPSARCIGCSGSIVPERGWRRHSWIRGPYWTAAIVRGQTDVLVVDVGTIKSVMWMVVGCPDCLVVESMARNQTCHLYVSNAQDECSMSHREESLLSSFLKSDYLTSNKRLHSVSLVLLYSTPSPKYPASFHAFMVGPSYGPWLSPPSLLSLHLYSHISP